MKAGLHFNEERFPELRTVGSTGSITAVAPAAGAQAVDVAVTTAGPWP